ncbi:hypothetical protein [Pseudanabaena sp. lw0831]|uniref:hypothetical protein n=1 Tax=Pseudanabaena sp. lw0831 TaxID=1357935 RepID=UPI001915B655|nr:hypothetical protein [Pseudanabaena sp. lw0831]
MKTPGFTAETSLYQSSQHYQMAMSKNSLTHLPVLPQLRRLYDGPWRPEFEGGIWGGGFAGGWRRETLDEWVFSNGRPSWANETSPPFRDTINPGIGDVRERQSRVCVTRCNRIMDPAEREDCLFYCNP